MMSKRIAKICLLLFIGIIIAAPTLAVASAQQSEPTIVDIATEDGRFTILTRLLEETGLASTLRGPGPFTVFAPTDEAFAAVPDELLDRLENNPDLLREVLLYHVVQGRFLAADVVNLPTADTALGQPVTISVEENVVRINDAQVVATDIQGANGVIHIIDAILLPPSLSEDEGPMDEETPGEMPDETADETADETPMEEQPSDPEEDQNQEQTPSPQPPGTDIVDTAVADGRFTTLVEALQAAELVETLKGPGPFTVFAPTDEAFAALPEGTLESLLNDIPQLRNILLYHVVRGRLFASDVTKLGAADTVLGPPVSISVEGETVKINEATILITDIEASNGVIHVIDAVLTPPDRAHPPVFIPPFDHNKPTYNHPVRQPTYNRYDKNHRRHNRPCCGSGNNGYHGGGYDWGGQFYYAPFYGRGYYNGGGGYNYSYYSYHPYRYRW